jgi:hypothetical protein
MNRRGFLGSILAAAAAPAIIKVENAMRLWVPRQTLYIGYDLSAGYDLNAIALRQGPNVYVSDLIQEDAAKALAQQIDKGLASGLSMLIAAGLRHQAQWLDQRGVSGITLRQPTAGEGAWELRSRPRQVRA